MFALPRAARKAFASLTAGVAALTLAACQPVSMSGGSTGPSINTSAPVPVALLVPRGSGSAGDDVLAQSLENAARLAANDLDGVQIDLRVYNTAGNAATAQSVASKAIDDGAKIILGPVYGESANAVGIVAAQRGVNVLAFSNNPTVAGGNVFILGPTFQNTANRLTQFARSQGKQNIVVVSSTNLAGQLGQQAIANAAQTAGVNVAANVTYEFSQQGVMSAVPRVKSAVDQGADAIFLTADTSGALPLFSQLLPEQGVSPAATQFIGLTRWDIPPQTLELPGVQGGWFAMPDPNLSQQFSSRYAAAYGGQPHPIGSLAYDGIAAIGALVKQGRGDALTGQALTQSAGFQGVGGVFRLLGNGTNERGLAVATVRDGQVVVIDAAPRAFGGFGF
ncbi:penicillin-binding protein activator [Pseudooceanicola nanhaiensis]|uniref:penicillin-binding protein activator n=1 Tax=Pseudooceanicola nanhaiensis TaxID=375761 RepID=UPI001CD8110A|nr:penicillin-binding protein activator [Pseudooceanicola nanhaiensis]MCA0919427.1 penicillin-binding protein activator [Pseudooceanicola nanhaiensis]